MNVCEEGQRGTDGCKGGKRFEQTEEDIVAFLTFPCANFAFATSVVEIWETRLRQYQGEAAQAS